MFTVPGVPSLADFARTTKRRESTRLWRIPSPPESRPRRNCATNERERRGLYLRGYGRSTRQTRSRLPLEIGHCAHTQSHSYPCSYALVLALFPVSRSEQRESGAVFTLALLRLVSGVRAPALVSEIGKLHDGHESSMHVTQCEPGQLPFAPYKSKFVAVDHSDSRSLD